MDIDFANAKRRADKERQARAEEAAKKREAEQRRNEAARLERERIEVYFAIVPLKTLCCFSVSLRPY